MKDYVIYTDGSCRGNGNGGVGIIWLKDGNKVFEYSKGFKNTTNNKMELMAIYIALSSIKKEINSLEIVSDSEYAIGVLTKSWNPKKNKELIEVIKQRIILTQNLVKSPIKWSHTYGHSDNEWNNLCDKLAQSESKNML